MKRRWLYDLTYHMTCLCQAEGEQASSGGHAGQAERQPAPAVLLAGGGGAGAVGGGEDGSGPGGDLRRSQEPAQQVAEAPGLRRRARRQQGAPW